MAKKQSGKAVKRIKASNGDSVKVQRKQNAKKVTKSKDSSNVNKHSNTNNKKGKGGNQTAMVNVDKNAKQGNKRAKASKGKGAKYTETDIKDLKSNIDELMDMMGSDSGDEDDEGDEMPQEDGEDSAEEMEFGDDDEDDELDSEENLKEQMKALAKADPKFHDFLSKENPDLLDFGADNGSGEEGDSESEDGDNSASDNDSDQGQADADFGDSDDSEAEARALAEMNGDSGSDAHSDAQSDENDNDTTQKNKEVTRELVKEWNTQLSDKDEAVVLRALKQLVAAFAAAVRSGEALNEEDGSSNAKNKNKKRRRRNKHETGPQYTFIIDSSVHTATISLALRRVITTLNKYLDVTDTTTAPPTELPKARELDSRGRPKSIPGSRRSKKRQQPQRAKKWTKVKNLVKSFISSVIYLLTASRASEMQAVVLRTLSGDGTARYVAAFPKFGKSLLTKCLELWAEGENHVRVRAFLVIRDLALSSSNAFLEMCIKGMYVSHVAHAKFVSEQTYPTVVFMENCVVEICSLDCHMSYRIAFTYIRQLGMHLRTAITSKKKESYASIYNWQYMRCLNAWARVINETYNTNDKENPLSMLVYPLTQILVGTIRLVPTARYYPMRLHCVKALNTLSTATHGHVPVASHLLEMLSSTHMKTRAKHTKGKAPQLQYVVKVPKSVLGTKMFQEGVLEQLSVLLLEYLSIHSYDVAFPEFAVPAVLRIKKALGTKGVSANRKFAGQLKEILNKTEESIAYILNLRNLVQFGPSDATQVRNFNVATFKDAQTPLSQYHKQWLATDEARRKSLREDQQDTMSVQDDTGTAGKRKAGQVFSDESEGEDESGAGGEGESEEGVEDVGSSESSEEGVQIDEEKAPVVVATDGASDSDDDDDMGEDEVVSGLPVWEDDEDSE